MEVRPRMAKRLVPVFFRESMDMFRLLSGLDVSSLALPAESLKTPDRMEMMPSLLLSLVGLKVAVVWVEERAVQLERVPPETETSDRVKLEAASESLKLIRAVWP